jgi:hypothetical protein
MDKQTLMDCERILIALHRTRQPVRRRRIMELTGNDWLPAGRFDRAMRELRYLGIVAVGEDASEPSGRIDPIYAAVTWMGGLVETTL